MCMEDVRLGRESGGISKSVTVGAGASARLCGEDVHRTRLMVSSAGATVVFIGPASVPPTATSGYALTAGQPFATLRVEEWGRLLFESWLAFDPGAGQIVSVADVGLKRE